MVKKIISNSGIQFLKQEIIIDLNNDVQKNIRFFERYDSATASDILEYAHFLSSENIVVSKRSLLKNGFINYRGEVNDELNLNLLEVLDTETNTYSVGDVETAIECFEGKWIPLPFFRKNYDDNFIYSPTNWSRMNFKVKEKKGATYVLDCIVAFDTKLALTNTSHSQPFFTENEMSMNLGLCSNEDLLLKYCGGDEPNSPLDRYVESLYTDAGRSKNSYFPRKHCAFYIYFIKYIEKLKLLPDVELINSQQKESVDVDLVLDVGNARTCGVLFDYHDSDDIFNQAEKLILTDLSDPRKSYDHSFSMRLAFSTASFGNFRMSENQFKWPSILRLGSEAKDLIYSNDTSSTDGIFSVNNHSSPKRYLWDTKEARVQWEFIDSSNDNPIKSVFIEGVSDYFNSDGSLNLDGSINLESKYSKRSLMTFVFLEILCHAYSQMNSIEFREKHGSFSTPRSLKRLVVTCPTAMTNKEQYELRKAAQEARVVLNKIYGLSEDHVVTFKEATKSVTIVPSLRDLKLNQNEFKDKEDWSYDEATSCQLVYLYAEISKRYLNNCADYFELYGKKRTDLGEYEKKSVTIGSVDIGGGTTDLMICSYKYNDGGKTVITPVPHFWESFNYAGDDLVKEIISQVILDGEISNSEYNGTQGVIYNKLKEIGCTDVYQKMSLFFGENVAKMHFNHKKRRQDFNLQVCLPIAYKYLELTEKESENISLNFRDFFPTNTPSQKLLDDFNDHFGFRFEELEWKFNLNRINEIITTVFDSLLKKLSSVLYAYGCDIVLLAGRPTLLSQIESLFTKFYPVVPNRIISLNKYRVGKWYPFQDGSGYFEDQKSIVAVGAMIGMLGSKLDVLDNFRIDMSEFKEKMTSSAKFFGKYEKETQNLSHIYITPEENRNAIEVAGIPFSIGTQQLQLESYPSKPVFVFDFNHEEIEKKARARATDNNPNTIREQVERLKQNISSNMPLKVRIGRNYRENPELLEIDSITDSNREDISPSLFELRLQTLPSADGYWLDSGAFNIGI